MNDMNLFSIGNEIFMIIYLENNDGSLKGIVGTSKQ